ncbi:C2 domain [Popillia japonica]|uniref:C2 domain n=1 Tax=Popillia japonica TaxID=7064 RepID=A0AAW1JW15_POPJA
MGELMFSLSYLPTAERLTVVVVKARKLKFEGKIGDPFVKVYLLQHGKKIHKKKTSTKKTEKCPIFNEAMMFSVPAHSLQTIQLRLTVAEISKVDPTAKAYSIGHVIVGAQATGRSLSHWNQMLTALRKPVAMWHPLRK